MFQTEYLHLSVFNMITGLSESKILTIHISCECKCKFDGKKVTQIIKRGIMINVGVSAKIQNDIKHVNKNLESYYM